MTTDVDRLDRLVATLDSGALLAGGRSPHTLAARTQDAQALASFMAEEGMTILQMDGLAAVRFRDWCSERYSPATVNRRISTLRLIVRRLRGAGMLEGDPCAEVRDFSLGDGGATPALTKAQAQDLVATTDDDPTPRGPRDRALIRLGLRTGLRCSEILGLAPKAILEVDGHQVARVTVKGQKSIRVKLSAVVSDLERWRIVGEELQGSPLPDSAPYAVGVVGPWRHGRTDRLRDPQGWALSPRPMSRSTLARVVARRGRQAAIPFKVTPHVLRATFITLTLHAGAPAHRVQRSVGHSDPRTTLRYDARRDELEDHPSDYLAGV